MPTKCGNLPEKRRTALWKNVVKKLKGKNGAQAPECSGGNRYSQKKDLKGTEHPMADDFGESSNRSGENHDIGSPPDILGEWQGWCPANSPVGGNSQIFFLRKKGS